MLRTVEERGVRFIELWFTDVLGIRRGFTITPAELEGALEEGMTFDGSAVDGFSRVQESDVLAVPDVPTFQVLHLRDHRPALARVFCDITYLDGTPFEGDPRQVLRRTMQRAKERGYDFYAAPEIEYFYFASSSPTPPLQPLDHGSYFELTVGDGADELRRQTVVTLEDSGIPVEYAQHEDAPSQHEIDLRYTDALTMADSVVTTRAVIKEVAAGRGIYATFMPKPLAGVQGSGMHTHFSLFEGDKPVFYDPDADHNLSKVGQAFIAGLLRHAREITAVTNQWVNSYKRLVVGYEAPVHVGWARNNRSALVRVPLAKRGKTDSTRIEYRAPDPACNPYLAFALVLAAGLKGVDENYELPPEVDSNLFEMTPAQLHEAGIVSLPGSLSEALTEMEGSELVRDTLGPHVFEWFLRNKRAEWAEYKAQVTQFELDRYLPIL